MQTEKGINKPGSAKNQPVKKKKQGKSLFGRVNAWLHLWLGLISGAVVFIVSVTGCIYAFQREITDITQPYQFTQVQDKPYLPPSQLRTIAAKHAFGPEGETAVNKLTGVAYGPGKSAVINYGNRKDGFKAVYLNPYTGEVRGEKDWNKDFFRFILNGHFYLWLPNEIGHPVVASAILIFVILLISGLVMWWPKNLKKANADKSFKIKWGASFKRVNYDLHNVLGFYVMLLALIIALTGLVWGFEWFAKGSYFVTSGGKSRPPVREKVFSDSTATAMYAAPEDELFARMDKQYAGQYAYLSVSFPSAKTDPVVVNFNPEDKTYYRRLFRYFDRNTLKEIPSNAMYSKAYEKGGWQTKYTA
ncbi:PepSY domain-containing protein [Chitinophaga sedimenti]|uniref:PepSY-associated TM helix domain-containing protein n=1 Tax=Chitinophaga sedimenti TaxID=2033606 RepID=UPI002003C592|nr:PepSY-associated TM helix domain-containing protein [Chitinophaga sedimenti]MCK7554359.1 PepSY domain-containing protein [Chitinophaga sedimenti]